MNAAIDGLYVGIITSLFFFIVWFTIKGIIKIFRNKSSIREIVVKLKSKFNLSMLIVILLLLNLILTFDNSNQTHRNGWLIRNIHRQTLGLGQRVYSIDAYVREKSSWKEIFKRQDDYFDDLETANSFWRDF